METANQAALLGRFTRRRPHVALEWDSALNKVVARRAQVGLSWSQACLDRTDSTRSHFGARLVDGFDIPEELLELSNLNDVLTNETWETCLSESERELLSTYLPEVEDLESALKALISGQNFHFGSPLHTWGAALCAGCMHPDVLLRQESTMKQERKGYFKRLRSYHGNMVKRLRKMKEIWAECEKPEQLLPRIEGSLIAARTGLTITMRSTSPASRHQVIMNLGPARKSHDHVIRNVCDPLKSNSEHLGLRDGHCGSFREQFQGTVAHKEIDLSSRQEAKRRKIRPFEEDKKKLKVKLPVEGTKRLKVKFSEEGTKKLKVKFAEEGREGKEFPDSDFEREWFKKYVEVTVGPIEDTLANAFQPVKVTRKIFNEVKLRSNTGEEVHIDTLHTVEGHACDFKVSKKVSGPQHCDVLVKSFWRMVLKDLHFVHSNFMERKQKQLKLAKSLASSCTGGFSHLQSFEPNTCEVRHKEVLSCATDLEDRNTSSRLVCTGDEENPHVKPWLGKHLLDRARSSDIVGMLSMPAVYSSNRVVPSCEKEAQNLCLAVGWNKDVKDGMYCSKMVRMQRDEPQESSLSHMQSGENPLSVLSVGSPDPLLEQHLYTGKQLYEAEFPQKLRHQCSTELIKQRFVEQGNIRVQAGQYMDLCSGQGLDLGSHFAQDAGQYLTEQMSSQQYKHPHSSLLQPQRQPQKSMLPLPVLQPQYPHYNLSSSGSLPLPVTSVDLAPVWSGSVQPSAGGALRQFGGVSWTVPDTPKHWDLADVVQTVCSRAHLQIPPSESSVNPKWDLPVQTVSNSPDQISQRPGPGSDLRSLYSNWAAVNGREDCYKKPSWFTHPLVELGTLLQQPPFVHSLWPSETGPPKTVPQLWGGRDCRPT